MLPREPHLLPLNTNKERVIVPLPEGFRRWCRTRHQGCCSNILQGYSFWRVEHRAGKQHHYLHLYWVQPFACPAPQQWFQGLYSCFLIPSSNCIPDLTLFSGNPCIYPPCKPLLLGAKGQILGNTEEKKVWRQAGWRKGTELETNRNVRGEGEKDMWRKRHRRRGERDEGAECHILIWTTTTSSWTSLVNCSSSTAASIPCLIFIPVSNINHGNSYCHTILFSSHNTITS